MNRDAGWQYELRLNASFLLPFMATEPTRIVRVSAHHYNEDEFLEGIYINKNKMLLAPLPLKALNFSNEDIRWMEICEPGELIILEINQAPQNPLKLHHPHNSISH